VAPDQAPPSGAVFCQAAILSDRHSRLAARRTTGDAPSRVRPSGTVDPAGWSLSSGRPPAGPVGPGLWGAEQDRPGQCRGDLRGGEPPHNRPRGIDPMDLKDRLGQIPPDRAPRSPPSAPSGAGPAPAKPGAAVRARSPARSVRPPIPCCGPLAATTPNSAICPRSMLIVWVRWAISRSRTRCTAAIAWSASLSIGTKRIEEPNFGTSMP
jgi:hypothetical protein